MRLLLLLTFLARVLGQDDASLATALKDVAAYEMDVADLLTRPHHWVMEEFHDMVNAYKLEIDDMISQNRSVRKR